MSVRPLDAIVDELVQVKTELTRIRGERESAVALLADADGRLAHATARDKGLREELEGLIRHRVTHPAAPTAAA